VVAVKTVVVPAVAAVAEVGAGDDSLSAPTPH
jgi:hypothetical protein